MKMSAVTSLLKYYPLPVALETIAEAGYDGVELWGGFPHAYAYDLMDNGQLNDKLLAEIRRMIGASGLESVAFLPEQVFYPVNYLITDSPPFSAEPLRQRSMAYFKAAITVCAALELSKMLVVTPFWGWLQENGQWTFGPHKDLVRVVDALGEMAQHAQSEGVTLLLEPLTHLETTAVETLDDLLHVLEAVNSPALAAMLDTGHVHVTANKLGLESSTYWREHISKLGNRLQHLHIDDNLGDLDAHLLPGEGTFDFADAMAALKDSGYSGFLSAELMMMGANPVPPTPLDLLRHTHRYMQGVMS